MTDENLWKGSIVKARVEARYQQGHGLQPKLINTPDDVDELIDALLNGPAHHSMAELHSLEREKLPSGFFDHELLVGVYATLQIGAITFMDESGNHDTVGDSESREDPVYHFAGHMTEFPERSEIPLELVRQTVKEFVSSGGHRPECVAWKRMEWCP